ncbi:MAG: tRNA (adenosine(37)-N6)-dimethylallyltransferase MiaA [Saprospiraceae bacterium]|nr:tRNA (adenosine(37)-N6)-dimethylallyltransferase MiaA [Saprospiraceae bacterium]
MKKLIVIGGATATGKTAFAIELARQLGTEILSADSRQFYREMSIGTAKPSAAELAAAPHHFIGFLSVTDDYSVGDFERDALQRLELIFQKYDTAILVGGSGLYLRAVCEGLDVFPPVSDDTRRQVETGFQAGGLAWLQTELARRDPLHWEKVDRQNPARLRRALEVCWETGRPYSSFLTNKNRANRPFQPVYLLLDLPRPLLYARIDQRVDGMIAAGLEDEARALLPYRRRPPLRTVGYEEFFDFFEGKCTREEAISKIKQHSRNYAKRQATWFRKYGEWQVLHEPNPEKISGLVDG